MKLAVMQPYLLPYIGYFQLMQSVDTFVFYDDVTYIKRGWINRNRIMLDGKAFLFTLETRGAGCFKVINTVGVGDNHEALLRLFYHAYLRAPFYKPVAELLDKIFHNPEKNLSKFIFDSHMYLKEYLDIPTQFLLSSSIEKDNTLKGQSKIIAISQKLGASSYTNMMGGSKLYCKEDFSKEEIKLSFLVSHLKEYRQPFLPGLSIVDILMYNSIPDIRQMMTEYELVS